MNFSDAPYHLALIALYGVALGNCFRVLGNRLSPGAAIAWILVNLSMPVIGVPLYFLLGTNRLRGYVKRHRARLRELDEVSPIWTRIDTTADTVEETHPHFNSFRQMLSHFGPIFAPHEGSVELLVDGRSTFDAIFHEIVQAKHYIIVQYYILRSDRLGLELKRLLIEKAQAGLPIYILYDDMGSFWLSRQYIKDLRTAGARVANFLPVRSFKRFFQVNFRNHRKLVVVDGRAAFTGGLNVGEEYISSSYKKKKRERRYWRDTHVKVNGPAVQQLEEIFLEDWYFATREKIELVSDRSGDTNEPSPACEQKPSAPREAILQVIPTGPTDESLISILFFMHLISTAEKRLWIATPYFIPDPSIIRALELATLRGVDVRILLPLVSDHHFVHWVSLSYAEQVQAKGITVLLYEKGFMHQKVVLVDDCMSIVGTMNIDNRALYLNFETMVLAHGQAFNADLAEILQTDFLNSRYFRRNNRPFLKHLIKLRGNTARLLAPLL